MLLIQSMGRVLKIVLLLLLLLLSGPTDRPRLHVQLPASYKVLR